jgi:hypothetical protein
MRKNMDESWDINDLLDMLTQEIASLRCRIADLTYDLKEEKQRRIQAQEELGRIKATDKKYE